MEDNDKYLKLAHFWNQAFAINHEEIKLEDIKDLAPSKKLYDAAISLCNANYVLDYGCGSGWAALAIASQRKNSVLAVDVSSNAIKSLVHYQESLALSNLEANLITSDWLKSVPNNTFDGLICSNVLDVLPLKMSEEIIFQFARILKKGSKVVIGLNFYISEEMQSKRQFTLVNDELYIDGILRLLNKKDEEWQVLFDKYFVVTSLSYFAWPNETKETRRLFTLIKR